MGIKNDSIEHEFAIVLNGFLTFFPQYFWTRIHYTEVQVPSSKQNYLVYLKLHQFNATTKESIG